MKFILEMARREIRTSWKRLLFFFLCIGIGVGSIIALRSVIQNLNEALASEARTLLAADVQIDSTRPWLPETLGAIDRVAQQPLVTGRTETIESPTMVRPAADREGALMIELKGIDPPFPLYGEFALANNQPFDHALLADNGAVVAPLLLERLNLRIGDRIRIGTADFEIRGVLAREPGSSAGFRLGPRVYIQRGAVESAGLTGFGSRARRRLLLRAAPGQMETLVRNLRAELKGTTGASVRSYKESQDNLRDQFARAENYLSLTGLVVLVLGGIGVSNVTRVFIEQKRRAIAILKCLGGSGWQISTVYLLQMLALGAAGSLFGVALAKISLVAVAAYFSQTLPPNMSYGLQTGAVAQGLVMGLLTSLLFSVLPLLRIRQIKPRLLLRESDGISAPRNRFDVTLWATAAAVAVGLILLAAWQANSLRIGFFFLVGLAVAAGALYLAAMLLIYLVRHARHISFFPLRQAVNSLYRPGNQTRVIVMAVGLGAFLVIAIQSLESNLVAEFDPGRRENLPNMFLLDVQKDQEAGVRNLIEQLTGESPQLVPTVRARFVAVNDQEVEGLGEMRRERGRLGREFVLTYRPNLDENETIVAGKFWDPTPAAEPEISIEEGLRGERGLDVGSTATFDILGRQIKARVTSVRRVDWRNSRTGFMVIFRPGALESAPQTFIGAINGPADEAARSRFQRALLDQYPNISVIDVAEIVRAVVRILDNVTLAVSFIGAFVFLSGVLILAGSVAMTKYQRTYEAAVLKTLGAQRKTLLLILLAEYGLLGLVAGLIGSVAAVGLSYAVSRFVFDIPWSFSPLLNFGGVLATALLVVVVGALASLGALSRKPLATLRAQ